MKKIFFCLACLLPVLPALSQDQDSSLSLAVPASESADYYEGAVSGGAKDFQVTRDKILYRKAFQVNSAHTVDEVYDRAVAFARLINTHYKTEKSKTRITVPVTWLYSGGANECIENMELQGTLVLEIKGTKTRITLSDISYTHLDKDNSERKDVAKSDLFSRKAACAPEQGVAELLYNCKECAQSLKSVSAALERQFNEYAGQYQNLLRKY